MTFDAGVLLSAIFLLVWISWVKTMILGSVIIGIGLQIRGFYAPEQHVGTVIIGGIGFVCTGAAGMVGKEAYCFGYREGWLLMILGFPFMVLANLLGKENSIVNSLGFSLCVPSAPLPRREKTERAPALAVHDERVRLADSKERLKPESLWFINTPVAFRIHSLAA